MEIFSNLLSAYGKGTEVSTILLVIFNITIFTFYTFFVYRFTTHKALYSKSFSISICVLPYLLGTIIMSLQSNYYLALGTIGALAIIRFRTAIKDPVDMIYLLWSIHTGIICGCQLYKISLITSIVVTIVILIMEKISMNKKQYILTLQMNEYDENLLNSVLQIVKNGEIKNRNKTKDGNNYIIEFNSKDIANVEKELSSMNLNLYSIVECSNGDVFW